MNKKSKKSNNRRGERIRLKIIHPNDVFKKRRNKDEVLGTYTLAKEVSEHLGSPFESFVERNKQDTSHINYKVYHLLTKPQIFALAYVKVSKNKGALTKGVPEDEEVMNWFGQMNCIRLAELFRDNNYEFRGVRRKMIPKPGTSKFRPVDTPTQQDRIVQEALRAILESVYEPMFKEFEELNGKRATNYGFRPTKSCMDAVQSLKKYGQRCNYAIEGDIVSAYNKIDRNILLNLIGRRIKDKKLLRLFRDLLDTTVYLEKQVIHSLLGTPQGGIASPILFNIYMFEFDLFVYERFVKPINEADYGSKKRSSLYQKQGNEMLRIRKLLAPINNKSLTGKALIKDMKAIEVERMKYPSYDVNTLPKRAVYARYADDWVLLVTSTKEEAYEMKDIISEFLSSHLKLELDKDKTIISHLSKTGINFLGFNVRMSPETSDKRARVYNKRGNKRVLRRTTSRKIRITPDKNRVLARLKLRKYCQGEDLTPIGIRQLAMLEPFRIVERYNSVMQGIACYYRECDNFYVLNRVSYILQYSCAKTLAIRKKITMKSVFQKYGKNLEISYEKKGIRTRTGEHYSKEISVRFNTYTDLKRSGWMDMRSPESSVPDPFRIHYYPRTKLKLFSCCCICNDTDRVQLHHCNSLRSIPVEKRKKPTYLRMRYNRLQIPVCHSCHMDITHGRYDDNRSVKNIYDSFIAGL